MHNVLKACEDTLLKSQNQDRRFLNTLHVVRMPSTQAARLLTEAYL